MEKVVTISLALGVASFCVFVLTAITQIIAQFFATPHQPTTSRTDVVDPGKLLEVVAKIIESLAKASPGTAALAGAIVFIAIACYGSSSIPN